MNIDDSPKNKLALMAEHGHRLSRMKLRDDGNMTEFYDVVRHYQPELADPRLYRNKEELSHSLHLAQMAFSWAKEGYHAYHLTHGLAAALMLTDPPKIVEGYRLELPVRTFVIRLPPGVVPVFGPDGQGWADLIWVNLSTNIHYKTEKHEEFFRWLVEWRSVSVWRDRRPDQLKDEDERIYVLNPDTEEPPMEDDMVCLDSGLRLVRNLVSWIAATNAVKNYKHPVAKRKKSKRQKPRALVFNLGREVKVSTELREVATEISLGRSRASIKGWKLKAQHVVNGHFRNQPYGEGMLLRKTIWIEPYLKGPQGNQAWKDVLGETA